MNPLFQEELQVVNVGLPAFAEAIRTAGGTAVQVEWTPPGQGDPQVAHRLAGLIRHPAVEAANQQAFAAYQSAQPALEGIAPARAAVPDMGERTILHSGPPIAWARMCGPVQGAIIGAVLYEGWAQTHAEAIALIERGEVDFAPCHQHRAVGPMAGVISPSMPVWIVLNREHGNRAYCNLNEGLGKVLRFGANSPDVIDRLKWMAAVLAPTLAKALDALGGVELKPLMAQALHMGDEVHNRNVAASGLLLKRLVPALLRIDAAPADIAAVAEFIAGNDHFFLNLSMAACKAMLDAAAGVPGSSMVTAMARNGVDFGIRLSGTGEAWFTAPAPVVDGLLFPGYSTADAAPDLGDSAITETAGVGGFAMAASPAIVQFVGGSPQDAIANTEEMAHITLGRNGALTLPAIDFAGTPAGIDARKVVDTGIAPIINTGIAHRQAGIGQIGAGITRAPLACFAQAVVDLAGRIGDSMKAEPGIAVVAVGGNALIVDPKRESIPDQALAATATAHHIAEMVAAGWNVVITHGSGPQVGFILRRSELALPEVAPVPMDYAAADLQGAIGYMFQRALRNEFRRRGLQRTAIAVVTQVLVDRDDPAFDRPAKPIGSQMDEATARRRAAELGWVVQEDSGRGWRRVVPSPLPQGIVEVDEIAHLVQAGYVVIACGGGGIPVVTDEAGDLHGVEAVIDKDLASSMLARELNADLLVISTSVPRVAINFGRPEQRWLEQITRAEAQAYLAEGHFAEGSMAPKVRAIIAYLDRPDRRGLITDPPNIGRALAGQAGTVVTFDGAAA